MTAITKATQAAERQRPIYAAAQPPQEPRQAPYAAANHFSPASQPANQQPLLASMMQICYTPLHAITRDAHLGREDKHAGKSLRCKFVTRDYTRAFAE